MIIIEWICSLFSFHVVVLISILKSCILCLVLKFVGILHSQLASKQPEDTCLGVFFSITHSAWLPLGRSFNVYLYN